jgi:hypothetical protein
MGRVGRSSAVFPEKLACWLGVVDRVCFLFVVNFKKGCPDAHPLTPRRGRVGRNRRLTVPFEHVVDDASPLRADLRSFYTPAVRSVDLSRYHTLKLGHFVSMVVCMHAVITMFVFVSWPNRCRRDACLDNDTIAMWQHEFQVITWWISGWAFNARSSSPFS